MKASDLKNGAMVNIDGAIYTAKDIMVKTPSSHSANTLYKVSFCNVVTKHKLDQIYSGGDTVQEVEFAHRSVKLSYRDKESCTFIDIESYELYSLPNELMEEDLPHLVDAMERVRLLVSEGKVEMEILDYEPALRGASTTARAKHTT